MRTTTILLPVLAALALGACGDDDMPPGTDGGVDGGISCPATAPGRGEMLPPCCYRVSNADRLDAPELRMAAFIISEPASLSDAVVTAVLANALDSEHFNWLLRAEITGTDASITTGFGVRSCPAMGGDSCPGDSTFAFDTAGDYPPVTFAGSLDGETLSAPRLDQAFTVPIFEEDGSTVLLTLPLNNMQLARALLSEDRTCVGARRGRNYMTDGEISAFITVEAAKVGRLVVGTTLDTTLCGLIRGETTPGVTCDDAPQSEWTHQPDALCEGTPATCTQDPGDGSLCDASTTCNAWFVQATFAAQGVEITN